MVSLQSLLPKIYLTVVLPLAVISSTYLFLYPLWHQCSFPPVSPSGPIGTSQSKVAPFRLLSLADPQIEGDTRLIRIKLRMPAGTWRDVPTAAKARDWKGLRKALGETLDRTVLWGMYAQKWVDLWGNDLYLAHVFRTMHWWTKPTHVTVLGDLLSSHWIKEAEFYRRAGRFYNIIFRGMEKVEVDEDGQVKLDGVDWSRKVMNVVGNHDVGYAGDMTKQRISRFTDAFGNPNYMFEWHPTSSPADFSYPPPVPGSEDKETDATPPVLRIIVLNSLTLDTPLWDPSLRDASFDLLNKSLQTKLSSPHQSTLLLTHLPFHKPAGVCTDGPNFDYYTANYGSGVKSQNHLSDTNSQLLLGQIFGMPTGTSDIKLRRKSRGLVMTGHDHPGCDVWHYWAEEKPGEPETKGEWSVLEYVNKPHMEAGLQKAAAGGTLGEKAEGEEGYTFEGVREITVRSMMGEFGGNAGLLSVWFDWDNMAWRFEYATCELGIQHFWWGTYIILFIAVAGGIVLGVSRVVGKVFAEKKVVPEEKKTQ